MRYGIGRAAAVVMVLAALWAPDLAAQVAAVEGGSACAACHDGEAVLRATVLPHASAVECVDCHHIGLSMDPGVVAARRLEACRSCHEAEAAAAIHGVEEEVTCLSCHAIHGAPPIERSAARLSAQCASCHEAHTLHGELPARDAPLCTSCHDLHDLAEPGAGAHAPGVADLSGRPGVPDARSCASCHEDAHPSHATTPGVDCLTCHAVDAAEPIRSGTARLDATCASCHADDHVTHRGLDADADRPGCSDCHSFHDDPPVAELSPRTVADRCGACHAEALDAYLAGGHARGVTTPELSPSVPTCLTCHDGLLEDRAAGAPDRLAAAGRCIACHGDRELARRYGMSADVVKSYLDDYHGETVDFLLAEADVAADSSAAVLTCADCHGAHSVGWSQEAVMADVCLECHEEADPKLAGAWVGHGPPGPDNQVMTWLVGLFYYFLIPFMLIGLGLIIFYELAHGHRHGARPWRAEGVRALWARIRGDASPERRMVTRFNVRERLEHAATSFTFVMLVVTGLPQLRPDLAAAHRVIALFGGVASTRLVHRVFGFTFVTLLVIHVLSAVVRAIRRRRMPIMLPTPDDFDAAVATVRHFVRGTPRPKIGKFDFAQKFEYGGMLMGGVVMAVTGLVLVYPETATLLIPGEWVAALRAMHGYEATFATLVVVLWHSWGVMLRPEVFPLDTSIFTGKVTVERLKHEHRLEYERLFPEEAALEAATEPGTEPLLPEAATSAST